MPIFLATQYIAHIVAHNHIHNTSVLTIAWQSGQGSFLEATRDCCPRYKDHKNQLQSMRRQNKILHITQAGLACAKPSVEYFHTLDQIQLIVSLQFVPH